MVKVEEAAARSAGPVTPGEATVLQHLVDGRPASSRSERAITVRNPSNGAVELQLPEGTLADVDRAVASARRAYEAGHWSDAAPSFRKRVLHRVADLIEAHGTELDALDAREMGKPVALGLFNAAASAALVRFCAEAVDKITGEVYASDRGSFVTQRKVPRGVVAALASWNFPTYLAALKAAPALAAGNAVVLKPSEYASRSGLRFGELALEAGLPPGVLNVTPGLGPTIGAGLARHHDVDMVTFTGSTSVGKLLLQYAGQSNMKVVLAECGGKSPQVVFDDGVDLAAAADAIARSVLNNSGQVCSMGARLLVHEAVEAEVLARVRERFGQIVMGDALDPATTFGPVANAHQHARILTHVSEAATEGAEVVAGGRPALVESGGCFVEPTVLRRVRPESRIAQEEVFGPVLVVMSFRDEREAARLANSTVFGLAGTVWTKDLSRGLRMAKALKSSVAINAAAPSGEGAGRASSSEPHGESGVGVEGGLAGIESYLRRQRIAFNHEDWPPVEPGQGGAR